MMMDDDTPIKKYPFPGVPACKDYLLFPDELENDDHVFFHGTAAGNLQSIIDEGFKFTGSLQSVSFGRQSSLALKYACSARTETSPDGCVLVVRFESLDKVYLEQFGCHLYNLELQPAVIGYCIVPADYAFV